MQNKTKPQKQTAAKTKPPKHSRKQLSLPDVFCRDERIDLMVHQARQGCGCELHRQAKDGHTCSPL